MRLGVPVEGYGTCQVCGYRGVLNRGSGLVRKHKQHRINRDGLPYVSYEDCDGSGYPPEPVEVTV